MHNLGSDIDCQTLPLIGCKRQPYTFDLSAAVLHLHSNPQKVVTIASLPMQAPWVRSFWVLFFGRKPIPKDQWKSKIRLTHLHLHRLKMVPASALRLGLSELLAHLQHHSSKVRRDALRGLLELCRDHPGVLNVSLVEFRFFRFDTFWHRLCHAICENIELFGELVSLDQQTGPAP